MAPALTWPPALSPAPSPEKCPAARTKTNRAGVTEETACAIERRQGRHLERADGTLRCQAKQGLSGPRSLWLGRISGGGGYRTHHSVASDVARPVHGAEREDADPAGGRCNS